MSDKKDISIMATVLRIAAVVLCPVMLMAQSPKKNFTFKDSLDGAMDLSDYIIDANGFIPIPIIITDRALGGFGGGMVPVFIKPRPPYLDSVKGKLIQTPIFPDITGGAFFYTLNNTWGTAVFRSGTFIKSRIKYLAGAAYTNINLFFYRTVTQPEEKELKFEFNFKATPVFLQATKRLGYSYWYAGLKYLFLNVDVKYVGDEHLPPELGKQDSYNTTVSVPGMLVELDNRDNIFTPDKGMKFHVDAQCSNSIFGSDYDYWRINYYMYLYKKISKQLTGGWRVDGQQSLDDAPFFMLPYIDMRGIPAMRYQGKADILTELEARWDFTHRWSLLFFGGTGKAFDEWENFGSADWVYTYGTGFRYLLARKFKLRAGLDVAKGPPGSWGYYIVFGSNWKK